MSFESIRLADGDVLLYEPHLRGGIIEDSFHGERVVVQPLPSEGRILVGCYAFTPKELTALTSCLLSTLIAMKDPSRGATDVV